MSQEYSDTLTRLLDQLEDSERWQLDDSFSSMSSLCKEYLECSSYILFSLHSHTHYSSGNTLTRLTYDKATSN